MDQGAMKAGDPLGENEKRRLVLKLVAQLSCAECGRRFNPHDFSLVHRWKDLWVLGTRCRHCDVASHVIVFMRLDAEVEPVTDLTADELEAAEEWSPISADDVLDVHALLSEFDGDLGELFES
jgi:hypothetical protein